jgi:hypothetical protein
MMGKDFIPQSDGKFLEWVKIFVVLCKQMQF